VADVYCDYTNGDDTTGTGTSGNPYKTVQKGLDNLTGGNTLWVSTYGTQILAAPLTWNTGYTAVANTVTKIQAWDNGGAGLVTLPDLTTKPGCIISCNSAITQPVNSTSIPQAVVWVNCVFEYFTGPSQCQMGGSWSMVSECEFRETTIPAGGYAYYAITGTQYSSCYFNNLTAGSSTSTVMSVASYATIDGCRFDTPSCRVIRENGTPSGVRVENTVIDGFGDYAILAVSIFALRDHTGS